MIQVVVLLVAPGVSLPGLPGWGTAQPPLVGDIRVLPVLVPPGLPEWCFPGEKKVLWLPPPIVSQFQNHHLVS
ncbi:hypothetical protein L6452_19915 [Arctium lappa]|uniref:Uncharacterized protein n=1 Tax=Arctium lappa TaxID=4217 RepID=A0ACB9B9D6_ARCLA|nr:hypothetical protein L6452_19915 [Arctium lappa]